MKKAYFYVTGFLLTKDDNTENEIIIKLDNNSNYKIENFGVNTNFNDCKIGAILDLITESSTEQNIYPYSYLGIFEIELKQEEFESIDDISNLASFDILEYIMKNKEKLIYSVRIDQNKNHIKNFISIGGE